MSLLKKAVLIILLALAAMMPCMADSYTLRTEINNVNWLSGFGWGLFPVGTYFEYKTGFHPFDSLTHGAEYSIELSFDMASPSISGYDYKTGKPTWSDGSTENTLDLEYFRIGAQINTYLQQGFGINPIQGSGPLVNVNLRWVSRFVNSSESLNVSNQGDGKGPSSAIFNKPPFSNGEVLVAYPWLEGGRQTWNNTLSLSTYWYFRRGTTRTDNYNGAYMDITLEAGPWWLGNSVLPDNITSNYYKAHFYLEEYLTAFVINQDNGWNWLNLVLGHSNSLGYTWGDVIPEHKIQTDRLRGYFNDSLWIRFTGPQFIATDCYPYFQVTLNNNLAFGGVQNEITGDIHGVELISSVNFEIHLRLFGFMHVNYTFGYDFIRGFSQASPAWRQSGQLGLSVSL